MLKSPPGRPNGSSPPPPPPPRLLAALGTPTPPAHHVRFLFDGSDEPQAGSYGGASDGLESGNPAPHSQSNTGLERGDEANNPFDLSAGLGPKPVRRMSKPPPPPPPAGLNGVPPLSPPPPPPPPKLEGDKLAEEIMSEAPIPESSSHSNDPARSWDELDEEKKQYFQFFQLTEAIKTGALMKVKTGVAGSNPSSDSFTRFKSSKRWVVVCWSIDSISSDDWCIGFFDEEIKRTITLDFVVKHASKIMPLSEVSDVYIDPKRTSSFRIYRGLEATQCTPLSGNSPPASAWADAIFALLQLQSFSDKDLLSLRYADYQHFAAKSAKQRAEHEGKDEEMEEMKAGLIPTPPRSPSPQTIVEEVSPAKPPKRSSILQAVTKVFSSPFSTARDKETPATGSSRDDMDESKSGPPREGTEAQPTPMPTETPAARVGAASESKSSPSTVWRSLSVEEDGQAARKDAVEEKADEGRARQSPLPTSALDLRVVSTAFTSLKDRAVVDREGTHGTHPSAPFAPQSSSSLPPLVGRDDSPHRGRYQASVEPQGSRIRSPLAALFQGDSGYLSSGSERRRKRRFRPGTRREGGEGMSRSDTEVELAAREASPRGTAPAKAMAARPPSPAQGLDRDHVEVAVGRSLDTVTTNPLRGKKKRSEGETPRGQGASTAMRTDRSLSPTRTRSTAAHTGSVRSPSSELGRATVLDGLFQHYHEPASGEDAFSNAEALQALYDSSWLEDWEKRDFRQKHLSPRRGPASTSPAASPSGRKKWLSPPRVQARPAPRALPEEDGEHSEGDGQTPAQVSPKFVHKFRRTVDTMHTVNAIIADMDTPRGRLTSAVRNLPRPTRRTHGNEGREKALHQLLRGEDPRHESPGRLTAQAGLSPPPLAPPPTSSSSSSSSLAPAARPAPSPERPKRPFFSVPFFRSRSPDLRTAPRGTAGQTGLASSPTAPAAQTTKQTRAPRPASPSRAKTPGASIPTPSSHPDSSGEAEAETSEAPAPGPAVVGRGRALSPVRPLPAAVSPPALPPDLAEDVLFTAVPRDTARARGRELSTPLELADVADSPPHTGRHTVASAGAPLPQEKEEKEERGEEKEEEEKERDDEHIPPPPAVRSAVTSPSRYVSKASVLQVAGLHHAGLKYSATHPPLPRGGESPTRGRGTPVSPTPGTAVSAALEAVAASVHKEDRQGSSDLPAPTTGATGEGAREETAERTKSTGSNVPQSRRGTAPATLLYSAASSPAKPSKSTVVPSSSASPAASTPLAHTTVVSDQPLPSPLPPPLSVRLASHTISLEMVLREQVKQMLIQHPQGATIIEGKMLETDGVETIRAVADLTSDFYLQLHRKGEAEEMLFIPAQCVVGIDIDQRLATRLFRISLTALPASFPRVLLQPSPLPSQSQRTSGSSSRSSCLLGLVDGKEQDLVMKCTSTGLNDWLQAVAKIVGRCAL